MWPRQTISGFRFKAHSQASLTLRPLQSLSRPTAWSLLAMACAGLLLSVGCTGNSHKNTRRQAQSGGESGSEMVKSLAESINHLEEFDAGQMMAQVRDRLNQWAFNERPTVDWQADPMVATLPERLQQLPELKRLKAEEFSSSDVSYLQEVVWLRDIAKTTRAAQFDDLGLAQRAFDWTIRNLQLRNDPQGTGTVLLHGPRDILLLSRATAEERAWIFILLARQMGLEAVLLALPGEADANAATTSGDKPASTEKPLRPWLPALIQGKNLYLFDTRLGLPIPGPGGKGVATLAEVAADDSLLRALDVDEKHPYPCKAADLQQVVPLIEASPTALSQRMKALQSRFTGTNSIILSTSATAQAQRLADIPHVAPARLWSWGYELLDQRAHFGRGMMNAAAGELMSYQIQPQLAQGRALQFKGRTEGPKGAKTIFMSARPSDIQMRDSKMDPNTRALFEAAKQNASLWLGIIAYDEGNYSVAIDYFKKRTLEAAPDGPWSASAQYNLGRAYEANGELSKAIEMYEDDDSPQRVGNLLRARALKKRLAEVQASK
jgi:tetratricopeptide (TPR) repeat protein